MLISCFVPDTLTFLIGIDTSIVRCNAEADEALNCPGLQDYKAGLHSTMPVSDLTVQ